MLTIQFASNPVYATPDNSVIDLQVKFEEFDEVMPFHAMPTDPMPYGVELYNRAVAGEFGPVTPYAPKDGEPQPTVQGTQTL